MKELLDCFNEEHPDPRTDKTLYEWNILLDNFKENCIHEFCPTCGGEGYEEKQLDVDEFTSYPCSDCQNLDFDAEPSEEDIDEYRCWAGIEDPYKEK